MTSSRPEPSPAHHRLGGETTELLQALIRAQCVNDGTVESGQEVRNADLLAAYLGEGTDLDMETFEGAPGRRSLVTRIEGSDPSAPTVCLMGHTDVVPVSPSGWTRDPFGGELVDGEVWGRGAIDMLNLTASMAVAVKHLAQRGWQPRGTLIYLGVADEENGGKVGAEWLTEHHYDAVRADYVLTESGGIPRDTASGTRLTVTVAEKGVAWRRLRIGGTPGHGSMPWGSDNAVVKAAEVVRRLESYRPEAQIGEVWSAYVDALNVSDALASALRDPTRVDAALADLDPRTAKLAHACTHTTMSPNVIHGGVKTNVIPDTVDLDVDIRTLPGETAEDVSAHLGAALGDLAGSVDVSPLQNGVATESPRATPLWDAVERVSQHWYPGASLVPRITPGGTDARFYREKGAVAYGFGLFSRDISIESFASMFHGNDERVDVESLRLSTAMWVDLVEDLLG